MAGSYVFEKVIRASPVIIPLRCRNAPTDWWVTHRITNKPVLVTERNWKEELFPATSTRVRGIALMGRDRKFGMMQYMVYTSYFRMPLPSQVNVNFVV